MAAVAVAVAVAVLTGTALAPAVGAASPKNGAAGPLQWGKPQKVPGIHGLFAVSCPTPNFCMAVGHGDAVSYAKGRWSPPTPVGTDTSINGGLTTVSCTSASFCMAGNGDGDTFTFDGTTWSPLGPLSPTGLSQLSCPVPTFCGALDIDGGSYFYDGSAWSQPVTIPGASQAQWISCPSPGTCVAVDAVTPSAYRYTGGRWSPLGGLATSTPQGGSEPDTPSAVSCAGTRFCAALDDFGEAFTWHGARWSKPTRFDADLLDGTDAVSCPTTSFCMLIDGDGIADAWNGSSWTGGHQIDSPGAGLTDVSCAGTRFCMAVDARGRALRYS